MAQKKKVIDDIVGIFQKELETIGVKKVEVEWGPEEYNTEKGFFGFQIKYFNSHSLHCNKKYIHLPEKGLELQGIKRLKKEGHIKRYETLVNVMKTVVEEMQQRGFEIDWKPESFDKAIYPKFAYYLEITRVG
jgi:hypothetical protein